MATDQASQGTESPAQDLVGNTKWRKLSGWPLYIQNTFLAAITLLCAAWSIDLHHIVGIPVFKEQFLALIFALAMAAIFIGLKVNKKVTSNEVPVHDWILAILCLICGLFVVATYRDIVETIGELRPERVVLGYAAVILVFEATRRATGWALVALGAVFIGYSALSDFAPGILNVPSTPLNRIATYLYLDNNSLFGT